MSITELLKTVGDDNITLQNIMQSSPDLRVGQSCGRVSFDTDSSKVRSLMNEATGKPREWVCLAVWFPADKLPTESK
jgi:hypothetical protein